MFERIADRVLGAPRTVAALIAVVFVLVGAGAMFTQIDLSFAAFFGRDDPANVAYQEYREHWGADDDLMLVVIRAEGEADLLEPERMQVVAEVTEALDALPVVRSVTSLANAPPMLGEEPGVLDMEPIYDGMPEETGAAWTAWRDRVLHSRLFVPTLVSEDGRTMAMAVEAKYDTSDVRGIRPIVRDIRATLDAAEARSDLRFGMAGIPPVRAAFFGQFLRDQLTFVPAGVLFMSVCLVFIFRRVHGVLVPGLAAFVPVVMVFGVMGWVGESIGLLSQTYTTVLPAIAIADAIHMVSRFHEVLRREAGPGNEPTEAQRRAAIREAATRIGAACMLTSITTGIGFFSLVVADMPILQSFGFYASIGIFFAYLGLLFLVPLALLRTKGSVPQAGDPDDPTLGDRFLLGCANLSIRHPWAVLAVTAVLVAGALWYGRLVVVDNNLSQSLQASHPVTQANVRADQNLGGIVALEVDLRGDPDVLKDPDVLSALLEFEAEALEHPQVRQVTSPATWAALLSQATTGDYAIPDSAAAAAQYFLLAESDPTFLRMVDGDYSRGRMVISMRDKGGIELIESSDSLDADLQQRLEGLPLSAAMTGTPYVAYRGINGVTADLRASLALAFVTITVIIGLLFRDVRTGLLCLVPNALPLIVGYGLMGFMGWLLDPTPAVIFTVALGIAVDDTLHLVIRMREELRSGLSMEDAIRSAVLHSGRAVGITSMILAFGFGINALSVFHTTAILGWLGSCVILTALLCDLFLLPALFTLWGRRPAEESHAVAAV